MIMIARAALVLTLSISLSALAGQGMSDNKKPGKNKGISSGNSYGTPPGLAKKPGAVPPGQYKKRLTRGDRLTDGYVWIDDYHRWRLPPLAPGQGYVRYDYEVYRVVRDTAVVLEALGLVSDLLK